MTDQPAIYQIQIRGQLDPSWSDWLEGLAIRPLPHGDTLISGAIVDQAALQAILDRIYALNLLLISVKRVGEAPDLDPRPGTGLPSKIDPK